MNFASCTVSSGYSGVFSILGEYYRPCLPYPSNSVWEYDPFADSRIQKAIEALRPAVEALAAEGIKIHTITFGSNADEERMREVADIGGGRHLHALSRDELVEAYREIALTLGTLLTE